MFTNWTEDPSLRENWVKVKKDIRDFRLTQYKIIDNEEFDPKGESEEADIFDKFIAREKKAPDSSVDDEYGFYCNSQAVPRTPTNLVRYWFAHEECPLLAQMALDLTCIPAMSIVS